MHGRRTVFGGRRKRKNMDDGKIDGAGRVARLVATGSLDMH